MLPCHVGHAGQSNAHSKLAYHTCTTCMHALDCTQAARAMVGLIVIAAFPVNHVPARSTILEFVSHHLTPQGGPPAATRGSGSSGSGSSRSKSASSSTGSSSSSSSGAGQEVEVPGSAYTAETLLFCGVSTAIALSVTDLGERAA